MYDKKTLKGIHTRGCDDKCVECTTPWKGGEAGRGKDWWVGIDFQAPGTYLPLSANRVWGVVNPLPLGATFPGRRSDRTVAPWRRVVDLAGPGRNTHSRTDAPGWWATPTLAPLEGPDARRYAHVLRKRRNHLRFSPTSTVWGVPVALWWEGSLWCVWMCCCFVFFLVQLYFIWCCAATLLHRERFLLECGEV